MRAGRRTIPGEQRAWQAARDGLRVMAEAQVPARREALASFSATRALNFAA
jgi:hypothetical protein